MYVNPPQYFHAPASWPLTFWPWKCCSSHMWRGLCANFGLPKPLCSRVIPDVHDRQTSDRRQTKASLNAPRIINMALTSSSRHFSHCYLKVIKVKGQGKLNEYYFWKCSDAVFKEINKTTLCLSKLQLTEVWRVFETQCMSILINAILFRWPCFLHCV